MKPIIVDMKDMSDSTEVYESKPNRFMIYTIYAILLIIQVAFIWMYFFKVDIIVKSNGIFKGSNTVYEISNNVTGRVKENYVTDGQYVEEGDILYVLDVESLSETIVRYQEELETINNRLEILSAYENSLDGDVDILSAYSENPNYTEFVNRRALLFANIKAEKDNVEGQSFLYQGNIESISGTIQKYKEKIEKLNRVKQCILSQANSFGAEDSYYNSMINSYLASYNYTALQYDNQISDYQRKINDYNAQVDNASSESVNKNDVIDIESLKEQKEVLSATVESLKNEKTKALLNLELQQLSAIEQQIASLSDTILSMESNLTSAKLQLESANGVDSDIKKDITILTEKGDVAAEILSYREKQEECESYLKSYDIQNNNCTIKANAFGYFYAGQDLKKGTYVQEGTSIGSIYPEQESKYYAEIYVENLDIGKIKAGQEVKLEIAAYPSSEYGYFIGTVENVAKDISIDQSTGYAYYLVWIKCDNLTVKNKDGEEASLINGMACQAKIVIDEKNVLSYLLEKIDLLD